MLPKMAWGIWQIFIRVYESLEIGAMMTSFCLMLKIYEVKIYRGVMFHDNEEWCKNWKGIDLPVQNCHEEFGEFWHEHSKILKICTLMGFTKVYNVSAKKGQRSNFQWYWILIQNLKENWHALSKMTQRIFTKACLKV